MGAAGAVLCGGASTRLGRDKTVLLVGGRVLAAHSLAALEGAGVGPVVCIGGDAEALGAAGLTTAPDRWPGEGPLGGILTAFALHPDAEVVVVLAGDLSAPDPSAVSTVVAALGPDHDLAAPLLDGRVQWLHAAWRRPTAAPVLSAAFDGGERSIHRAASALRLRVVDGIGPHALADIDTPADLASSTEASTRELP